MTHPYDPGAHGGAGDAHRHPGRPGYAPAGPWQGPAPVPSTAPAQQSQPADGTRRLLAALVDLPLSVLLLYGGFVGTMAADYALVLLAGLPDNQVSVSIGAAVSVAVALALLVGYHWLPVARRGQTLGKRIAGLRVVAAGTGRPPSAGRAAGRAVVYGLLLLPCLLGHAVSAIMVATDERAGRSLPDRAARTRVVPASASRP